eukprot:3842147-Amphidinium_carterae.1
MSREPELKGEGQEVPVQEKALETKLEKPSNIRKPKTEQSRQQFLVIDFGRCAADSCSSSNRVAALSNGTPLCRHLNP